MKANILSVEGNVKGEVELPKCFGTKLRTDIIKKAFRTFDTRQPYGGFPLAGQMKSASGKFHQTQKRKYKGKKGLGISRIPRKIMSRRGTRFTRVGATIPGTKGGREAHPPRVGRIWVGVINQKEKTLALNSLIAATASMESLKEYYPKVDFSKISLPLVVEEKLMDLDKAKNFIGAVEKILGNAKKLARKGGVLVISGKEPKNSISSIEVVKAESVNVLDLAPSGKPGRLVIYTDGALEKLKSR